jgi:serine/threonine-protein kinase
MSTTLVDFSKQIASIQWNYMHPTLFGRDIPTEKTWTGMKAILQVLKTISKECSTHNCLFTPDSEVAGLQGVKGIRQLGCLELFYARTAVVRPEKLSFYSFGEAKQWNYFRLQTLPMVPTGLLSQQFYEQNRDFSEPVYQSRIVRYSASETLETGFYTDHSSALSEVSRYYRGGDFVIFSSASPFQELWSGDPGVHQRLGDKGFRAYIQEQVDRERKGRG